MREYTADRRADGMAPSEAVLDDVTSAKGSGRILVVAKDIQVAVAVEEFVRERRYDYDVAGCSSATEALEALKEQDFAVVVAERVLRDADGVALLAGLRDAYPSTVGILIAETLSPTDDRAPLEASGAFGYISKPVTPAALFPVLAQAFEVRNLRQENRQLRGSVALYERATGSAAAANRTSILDLLANAVVRQADTDDIAIMLPAPDDQALEVVAARGPEAGRLLGQRIPTDEGAVGWVARQRHRLVFRGGLGSHLWTIGPWTQTATTVLLPVPVAGDRFGVIRIGRPLGQHPFTPEQIDELAVLANLAGSVIRLVEAIAGPKSAEIEHEHSVAALRESNRELETALARIKYSTQRVIQQERLRALGEMASGVAHDFNNDIAMIVGFSELLLTRPDYLANPEKVRGHLQMIRSVAEDAAKVVDRLRDFSRQREEGEVYVPVNVNELVERCLQLAEPTWRAQAQATGMVIRVETELHPAPAVVGNEADLREALINLIVNAVDAMPGGGTLTIRSRLEDRYVRLEVVDTGVGMSDEVRQRCFEPFFTTKDHQRSGLGLSLVYGTVQRHDGSIEVESAVDQGTRFIVRLPVASATSAVPVAPPPDVSRQETPSALRVLLVEDEPALRRILTEFITIDGRIVESAADGRIGLELFRQNLARGDSGARFGLVITDLAMPELRGDDLAASIKQLSPSTPVILLTGLGEMLRASGEQPEGVDLVVAKPVSLAALQQAIAQVVGDR